MNTQKTQHALFAPDIPSRPSSIYLPAMIHPRRTLGHRSFDFSHQVAVMAIVNRTPDSFYDQGRTFGLQQAVEAAYAAIAQGADWVDIGGVPFAPGPAVSVAQEIERVVPVIEALRDQARTVISVDTFQPEVARHSIAAGAHVINDTSGLHDRAMAQVVADSAASLIITHSVAPPRTNHPCARYIDVARWNVPREEGVLGIHSGLDQGLFNAGTVTPMSSALERGAMR
jgi:dihydropteroate synthase